MQTDLTFAVAVFALFGIVGAVSFTAWLAWWMLEPINRAGGHLRMATRFMLGDVLALMVLLQAPLAIVGQAIQSGPNQDNSHYWVILGVFVMLVLVLWAASVSVVSRAGITHVAKRLTVIVLLVPGTLAVIVGWPLGLAALMAFLTETRQQTGAIIIAVAAAVSLVSLMIIIRRLSFWSLTGSPGEALMQPRRMTAPFQNPARPLS
jgi:hypothetical protein